VPAIEYVNQHYAEEIKISDLSDACGLSEAHFRKIFRENMNLTPGEFLTTFRIQKACERMMENQDSMEEIASKTGFRNANTFGRNFKKYMGISPYQWKLSSIDEKSKIQNYQISALEGW
jgi:AraC-like DNA-binding protein